MGTRLKIILVAFLLVGFLYFLFHGLTSGKTFLIPVTTAIILSMVMNPVALKFKKWGIGWGWAVLMADLIVILFLAFMVFLLAAQANQVANNWPEIESRIKPRIESVESYLNKQLNVSISGQFQESAPGETEQQDGQQLEGQQQEAQEQEEQQNGSPPISGDVRDIISSIITNVFGFLGDMFLILIYIFFFMFYQKKFENAIVGLVAENKQVEVKNIIARSVNSAQQYLMGRMILIAVLAGLYMISYTALGLEYAIFISLLAAIFSLIPYIGNVLGFVLAILASFVSGGGTGQIIAIAVIFSVIQFIESYILEPYVVGSKVDLNPVAVIVGVVLGGIVWGITGMILAIPLLGIIKVVFDNIEPLKPLGYILDESDISSGNEWTTKVQNWVKGVLGRK